MLVAVLALVVAATGAGYAAATIGTNDIKDGAVTSAKVKDGNLKATDLVKEQKYQRVSAGGPPNFASGGQGDCIWQDARSLIPTLAKVGYRTDRFGMVHLSGVAIASNGAGGDGLCDYTGEAEDGIVFKLPKNVRPASTQIRTTGATGGVIITGKALVSPGTNLPAGVVYLSGSPSGGALPDGIVYEPAGSPVVGRPTTSGKLTPQGARLLQRLVRR
jgi:hypothetical protein